MGKRSVPPEKRGYKRVWIKKDTLDELREICGGLTVNQCIRVLIGVYKIVRDQRR
jgi:hypothetical protein